MNNGNELDNAEKLKSELEKAKQDLEQGRKKRDRLVRAWLLIVTLVGLLTVIGFWQFLMQGR